KSQALKKSIPAVQRQNATLARVEELLQTLVATVGRVPVSRPTKKRTTRGKPGKRDSVLFVAILKELKGVKYCSFLDKHGIRPKWSDSGHPNYIKSYQNGDPWRKRVQDEKTRARLRMNDCVPSELATAVNAYLPEEFDQIAPLTHSRNSPSASKTSTHQK